MATSRQRHPHREAVVVAQPVAGVTGVPIWTTTPWTLPANEAVALNPQLRYVVIQTPDARYLLADELPLAAIALALVGTWVVIRGMTFLGDALVHGVVPGIALALLLVGAKAGCSAGPPG